MKVRTRVRAPAAGDRQADYARVGAAAAAELAKRKLCLEEKGGGVCTLDADHKPPHRARVGERIQTPTGPRRNIIEWRGAP